LPTLALRVLALALPWEERMVMTLIDDALPSTGLRGACNETGSESNQPAGEGASTSAGAMGVGTPSMKAWKNLCNSSAVEL
jgi:hypothetical protein